MKRISAGTVTFMMMAILLGLVSAYAVRSHLTEPQPQTVDVWVASDNLPRFARVMPTNIRAVPMQIDQVPANAITEPGLVSARLVATTIEAGQPITEANLFPIDGEPELSQQIPAGKRAVTISVTEQTALAGVLLPDSHVDVSLTAETNHPDVEHAMTVTLVRDVKVLATSQQRHRFKESSHRPLRTITVAATPRQANKLILAQQYGRLHVTLCSSVSPDTEPAADESVALADEVKTVSAATPADLREEADAVTPFELLGLAPPRVKKSVVAQIWRGTSMSEVKFQTNEIDEATAATNHSRDIDTRRQGIEPRVPSRYDADRSH